jgi:hypothetical protein
MPSEPAIPTVSAATMKIRVTLISPFYAPEVCHVTLARVGA